MRAVAAAYLGFARTRPALYDAMFARPIDLAFAAEDTPAPLRDAFGELRSALTPLVDDKPGEKDGKAGRDQGSGRGDRSGGDIDSRTEVFWSSLHGLVTLDRGRRLRVDQGTARLDILVDYVAGPHGHRPRAGEDGGPRSGPPAPSRP
nr:TetR-like C-terminal domain-containing protein [Actinoplanes nipponensis]